MNKDDLELLETFGIKQEDGWLVLEKNECSYQDLEDLIQTGLLGFCGCGLPEKNLAYIKKGLEHLKSSDKRNNIKDTEVWHREYLKWTEEGLKLFGNPSSEYFFWYWLDTKGLSEHGGSVPGWLTEEGDKLLQLLELWEKTESVPN